MPVSWIVVLGLCASTSTIVEKSASLSSGPGGVVDPSVRHPLPAAAVAANVEARLRAEGSALVAAHYKDIKDELTRLGIGTAAFRQDAVSVNFSASVWDRSNTEAVVTVYATTRARVTVAPSPWVMVPGQTTLSERTSKGIDTARDRLRSKCRDAGESFADSRPADTEYVSHAGLVGGFTENRSCRTWTNPRRRCYKHECSLDYEYLNPACQQHRASRATCTYEDWQLDEQLVVSASCYPGAKSWQCDDPAYAMSTPMLPGGPGLRAAYARLGSLLAQSLDAAEAAEPLAERPAGTAFILCEKERPAVRQFCSLRAEPYSIATAWSRAVDQHPAGIVDVSGFASLRSQPRVEVRVAWSDAPRVLAAGTGKPAYGRRPGWGGHCCIGRWRPNLRRTRRGNLTDD